MALATLALYLASGLAVAGLLALRGPPFSLAAAGNLLLRALLWPVFLPLLLPERARPRAEGDEARIRAAQAGLAAALRALGGLLGDGLALEMRRVEALGTALRAAAARRAELDALLASPENDLARLRAELEQHRAARDSPVAEILEQRLEHLRRLQALRAQTQAELERALARSGELATRLTLLRFDTGAIPAAATAQQLASSIDELCAVLGEIRAA